MAQQSIQQNIHMLWQKIMVIIMSLSKLLMKMVMLLVRTLNQEVINTTILQVQEYLIAKYTILSLSHKNSK